MFDWIQILADWLVYQVFGIAQNSHLGSSLSFFIYDTLKILILLFLITFVMGIVNSYFPIDRIRNFLSRNKLYGLEYLFASTFGKHSCSFWGSNALLFVFVCAFVYWFCERRYSFGDYFCVFDNFSFG